MHSYCSHFLSSLPELGHEEVKSHKDLDACHQELVCWIPFLLISCQSLSQWSFMAVSIKCELATVTGYKLRATCHVTRDPDPAPDTVTLSRGVTRLVMMTPITVQDTVNQTIQQSNHHQSGIRSADSVLRLWLGTELARKMSDVAKPRVWYEIVVGTESREQL